MGVLPMQVRLEGVPELELRRGRRGPGPVLLDAAHLGCIDHAYEVNSRVLDNVGQRAEHGPGGHDHGAEADPAVRRAAIIRYVVIDPPPLARGKGDVELVPLDADRAEVPDAGVLDVARRPEFPKVPLV